MGLGLVLLAPACTRDNPAFIEDGSGTGTDDTQTATDTTDASSESTSAETSAEATTSDATTTTDATTVDDTTAESSTSDTAGLCEIAHQDRLFFKFWGAPEASQGVCPQEFAGWFRVEGYAVDYASLETVPCEQGCGTCDESRTFQHEVYPLSLVDASEAVTGKCVQVVYQELLSANTDYCSYRTFLMSNGGEVPYFMGAVGNGQPTPQMVQYLGATAWELVPYETCSCDTVTEGCCSEDFPPAYFDFDFGDQGVAQNGQLRGIELPTGSYDFFAYQAVRPQGICEDKVDVSWVLGPKL